MLCKVYQMIGIDLLETGESAALWIHSVIFRQLGKLHRNRVFTGVQNSQRQLSRWAPARKSIILRLISPDTIDSRRWPPTNDGNAPSSCALFHAFRALRFWRWLSMTSKTVDWSRQAPWPPDAHSVDEVFFSRRDRDVLITLHPAWCIIYTNSPLYDAFQCK